MLLVQDHAKVSDAEGESGSYDAEAFTTRGSTAEALRVVPPAILATRELCKTVMVTVAEPDRLGFELYLHYCKK
jgi:hypothetical protein